MTELITSPKLSDSPIPNGKKFSCFAPVTEEAALKLGTERGAETVYYVKSIKTAYIEKREQG